MSALIIQPTPPSALMLVEVTQRRNARRRIEADMILLAAEAGMTVLLWKSPEGDSSRQIDADTVEWAGAYQRQSKGRLT